MGYNPFRWYHKESTEETTKIRATFTKIKVILRNHLFTKEDNMKLYDKMYNK